MSIKFKTLLVIASVVLFSGCKTWDGMKEDFGDVTNNFSSKEMPKQDQQANVGLAEFSVHALEGLENKKATYTSEKVAYQVCGLPEGGTMTVQFMRELKAKKPEQFKKCKAGIDSYMTGKNDKRFRKGGSHYEVAQMYVTAVQFVEF